MTPDEYEDVIRLLEQMKVEKDQDKFAQLVSRFQEIIERKARRLEPRKST